MAFGEMTKEVDKFRVYTTKDLDEIPGTERVDEAALFAMRVVANVLPFRVNHYVASQLIDWSRVPDDPVFQLVFPQRDMLPPKAFDRMADLVVAEAPKSEIHSLAQRIRKGLNPHPADQLEMNLPEDEDSGEIINGLQHKYDETVLFFPSEGQTCHSYCTFCFRWAQFVQDKALRIAMRERERLVDYLTRNKQVSDLLVTGGDPMIMKTDKLRHYLEALSDPSLDHIQSVRIGTKALTFWPQRFVTDDDADDLLRLFEDLVAAGKQVAIMAHMSHWQEFDTDIARDAIRRIQSTGAVIRSQSPILNHINADADVWAEMWRRQVNLGIIPYYMFVARDTGAKMRFEIPLVDAYRIYRDAIRQVSGLARTARGPSMSAGPGKVEVQGTANINGEDVFVLRFIQARNDEWVQRPFFAKLDRSATWLDELQPAFGQNAFFFEKEYQRLLERRAGPELQAAE